MGSGQLDRQAVAAGIVSRLRLRGSSRLTSDVPRNERRHRLTLHYSGALCPRERSHLRKKDRVAQIPLETSRGHGAKQAVQLR